MVLHRGVDHVSFVGRESKNNFFCTLEQRESNPILHKLGTDVQYVFGRFKFFDLESESNKSWNLLSHFIPANAYSK
jgi:hypothetical protein